MFIFGTNVLRGIYGTSPALPPAATVNDNIPMQFDFRWVYASILQDWFGASPSVLTDVLATHTRTIPMIRVSGSVANNGDSASLPTQYMLYQNFPNPFNPSTTIRFDLPRPAHVRLEVFNTAGERVALLIDADEEAGEHEVVFSANGLASGAYVYRLRAGDYVEARKLVILR